MEQQDNCDQRSVEANYILLIEKPPEKNKISNGKRYNLLTEQSYLLMPTNIARSAGVVEYADCFSAEE